jgi:hypothetical protein
LSGKFSRDWQDDGEELPYILESGEVDLVKLYAQQVPGRMTLARLLDDYRATGIELFPEP